ncbi:hypothetical protein HYH03_017851 [Edaphochlamys debaryana]|uniref:Uncharacterized protein n=1 Tax=Edaphochlamys debaryana TaxID=47281 RepID=A0A836BQ54_9CHLO|nr:hypothetical protein HYH03_017851 [Edaphochlamys debaryana]|eukprot:KAG2483253.1 hypothetical protein HYH03_017851 [Edaphochlamys debaryana]
MDVGPLQQSARSGCSFGDVLHILPSAAREVLVAALKSHSSLQDARLSCQVLRDLIDFQQTKLTICTGWVSYGDLLALCQEGRWLRRWPRCTQVDLTVDIHSRDALTVPFLAAPPEACQRITALTVSTSESGYGLPGKDLLALLSRLPGLSTLVLSAIAPDVQDDPLGFRLMTLALSMLPRLTNLTADWTYLPCIPSSLAGQLTRLELTSVDSSDRPPVAEVVAALPGLTALQELSLDSEGAGAFSPAEVLEFLDSAPPSLNSMTLGPIRPSAEASEPFSFSATFANGRLDTIHANGPWPMLYAQVAAVLAAAVLPSRALGPRLGLLKIIDLGAEQALPDPDQDPAAELRARCAKVSLGKLTGGGHATAASGMLLVRKFGVPETVKWHVANNVWAEVQLTPPKPGLLTRAFTLTTAAVVERAVARMAASPAEPGRASTVLLWGPLLQGLVVVPAALKATIQSLSVAAACNSDHYIMRYYSVLSAGAVVLTGSSAEAAEAVVAAAGRLAAAAGGGGGSGAVLGAMCTRLHLSAGLNRVLQPLWDGEEQGEGEGAAVSAGAEAGAASGRGGGGSAASELERVRSLLETCHGLRMVITEERLEKPL